MRKVEMYHPRLYLSVERNDHGEIEATYVSNQFCRLGKLVEQVIELDGIDTDISNVNNLIKLNKVELRKLEIFIARQEKTISTFRAKGKVQQFRMVSDSLDLLFE